MTTRDIEFGLDTPAYMTVEEPGQPPSGDVVIRNTIEEAVLADAVGIDSFNIGEHYRADLMDSAGHVMLGAVDPGQRGGRRARRVRRDAADVDGDHRLRTGLPAYRHRPEGHWVTADQIRRVRP